MNVPGWLAPLILLDLMVTAAVLWWVFRRRAGLSGKSYVAGIDVGRLGEFTKAVHPRIGDYVRANWSGVPEQLPEVLRSLLDEIGREARSRGLGIDRDTLKLVLARSLAMHGIGQGAEIRHALEKVA